MLRLYTLMLFVFVALPQEGEARHWIHVDSDEPKSEKTALLILNGFGGTRGGCKAQMAYWEDSGMDVYIPDVLLRENPLRQAPKPWRTLSRSMNWRNMVKSKPFATSPVPTS